MDRKERGCRQDKVKRNGELARKDEDKCQDRRQSTGGGRNVIPYTVEKRADWVCRECTFKRLASLVLGTFKRLAGLVLGAKSRNALQDAIASENIA